MQKFLYQDNVHEVQDNILHYSAFYGIISVGTTIFKHFAYPSPLAGEDWDGGQGNVACGFRSAE